VGVMSSNYKMTTAMTNDYSYFLIVLIPQNF